MYFMENRAVNESYRSGGGAEAVRTEQRVYAPGQGAYAGVRSSPSLGLSCKTVIVRVPGKPTVEVAR